MAANILIIENNLSGHRGVYLKWIAEAFYEKGNKVYVLLPEKYLSNDIVRSINSRNVIFEGFKGDGSWYMRLFNRMGLIGSQLINHIESRSIYRKITKEINIEYVFLPSIDNVLYALAIFGSPFKDCLFSGITMRPDFHYKKCSVNVPDSKVVWLKEIVFLKFLKNNYLKCLLTLDEPLYLYCKNNKIGKVKFLPEPATRLRYKTDESGLEVSLDHERRMVLVFGGLSQRKGITYLLNACKDLLKIHNLQLVLAGKADNETYQFLMKDEFDDLRSDGYIIILNRFVSDQEEAMLFSRAYICWLGYIGHYRPSGVLITAAKYNVPVISTDEGIIGC